MKISDDAIDPPSKPTKKEYEWKKFWFESNQFFNYINGLDDWNRLKSAYPNLTDEELLSAKEATYKNTRTKKERDNFPNFGFRIEHDGEKTLKDFFNDDMIQMLKANELIG